MSSTLRPGVVIPERLQGQWTTALISTYGADLNFFETRLLSQLAQIPLRMVLADDNRLAHTLAESARTGQRHRLVNRAYVAAPIRQPRAAHAKLIMLLGPATGQLIVGSGNLGYEGYAAPGELWHLFSYDEERTQHLNEFAAGRAYLDGLAARGLLDPPVIELLHTAWGQATWVPPEPTESSAIRTNLDQPLIDQLRHHASEPVEELVAHAPFHDADCAALNELIRQLNPSRIRLLVSDATSADPNAIAAALANTANATVERVQVKAEPAAYIHAKWVHLIHAGSETLLSGSANLSRSALLRSSDTGNIEIGVLTTGERGAYNVLYEHLKLRPVADVSSLGISYQGDSNEDSEADDAPAVVWSRLDGATLTLVFDRPLSEEAVVELRDQACEVLTCKVIDIDGETVRVHLSTKAAALLAEGGRVQIRLNGDDGQISDTWPFHLDHLRGRLDKVARREHLPRIDNLPEQDAELFELLQDLDRTLIIDRTSVWRIAKPSAPVPVDRPGEEENIGLEDLDWARVRRDPRYSGYFAHTRQSGLPPTDIQIILAAISGRLGDLGAVGHPVTEPADEGDLAHEGDTSSSEAEEAEKAEDELEDELTRRRIPVSTRTRMAFDRFVRRYAAALGDEEFINELGPIPAVRNAIVFNHVLLQSMERNAVSPRWGVDAQFKTWAFLWGTENHPSVVSGLDAETSQLVRADLIDTQARVTTLRGLAASFDHVTETDGLAMLRDAARHLLIDSDFALDAATIAAAAGGILMAPNLLEALIRAAEPTTEAEIFDLVLTPCGLPGGAGSWRKERVRRRGRDYQSNTFVITAPVTDLTIERAEEILAQVAVAAYYAGQSDHTYFRVRFEGNGRAVAYWDVDMDAGMVLVGGQDEDVERFEPQWPGWAIRAETLEKTITAKLRRVRSA